MQTHLDELCINTIRFLSIDAVQKADSGHPGMPMGTAPLGYVLFTKHLSYYPKDPSWVNRDRFILSAGHGSMLLYSLLYLTGYDMPLDEIKNFRQWGSRAPGHPEFGLTPGVDTTTGPLGQGFGNAVGMSIAQAHLASKFNRPGFEILNNYTYVIASDGDIMEGVSSEAASIAGHLKLNKLIVFYDSNNISLSASTSLAFSENVSERFRSYGWNIDEIEDGNDIESIDKAILKARETSGGPTLIILHTHIGYGSPLQDTYQVHGAALGEENVKLTKKNLGWPLEPLFYVPDEALEKFRQALDKGKKARDEWQEIFDSYSHKYPDLGNELSRRIKRELPKDWDRDLPEFPPDPKGTKTRTACGKVMNACAQFLPELIGGSGDLNPSTQTALKGEGDFESPQSRRGDHQGSVEGPWGYEGRNLFYGVREHAMGAITNGLSLYGGLIPFASTFLIFSDYMRPPMRLASLMKLHLIYLFTHDSIGLGEDGPTHQPIEHLMSLRAMPNIVVIRPCDANETVEAWRTAVNMKERPVALILTRQSVPTLDRSKFAAASNLSKGAYILADCKDKPSVLLIASGSEVQLAIGAYEKLAQKGIAARVISMPSWELFEEQSEQYKASVFPCDIKNRIVIEAAATAGWSRYAGDCGDIIGIDHFGASAPAKTVFEKNGFTVDNVMDRTFRLIEKNSDE
jgi:transketolase